MFAILFDSLVTVKPAAFAADLFPPAIARKADKPSRKVVSDLDRAWRLGFAAAAEDGYAVSAPISFTASEVDSFNAGVEAFYAGAWDNATLEAKAEQAMLEDALACGFFAG